MRGRPKAARTTKTGWHGPPFYPLTTWYAGPAECKRTDVIMAGKGGRTFNPTQPSLTNAGRLLPAACGLRHLVQANVTLPVGH